MRTILASLFGPVKKGCSLQLELEFPKNHQRRDLVRFLLASVAISFDRIRIAVLRLVLHLPWFAHAYRTRPLRLTCGFLLSSILTFPVALASPEILLIGGPLVFGYVHLVASYRIVSKDASSALLPVARLFGVLLGATLFSVLCQLILNETSFFKSLPYGIWEALIATLLFQLVSRLGGRWKIWRACNSLLVFGLLASVANSDPLAFVGIALILHNWIGFFYWLTRAKTWSDRSAAGFAMLIFGILHVLVAKGTFDGLLSLQNHDNFLNLEKKNTAWLLAPWSQEPIVWARALVLYTYGLSIHYFVWLHAIPQTLNSHALPNSFRSSLSHLLADVGLRRLTGLAVLAALGLGIWLVSYPTGKVLYFSVAALHGWIEILFL